MFTPALRLQFRYCLPLAVVLIAVIVAFRVPMTNVIAAEPARDTLQKWLSGWQTPPRNCRPRTRWWWLGSAVTKSGIEEQLSHMRVAGMGGVEISCVWNKYRKGNIPYLSNEWLEMVRHVAEVSKQLDMDVSLHIGAGAVYGGPWVAPEDRSKCLAMTSVDVTGPLDWDEPLPPLKPAASGTLVAVVAAEHSQHGLDGQSLTLLTEHVRDGRLQWQVPDGTWKIMAFRIRPTNQQVMLQNYARKHWVVDHFSKSSMQRYLDHTCGAFADALEGHLGTTVDSFFSDSFEVKTPAHTTLWNQNVLPGFQAHKGYDFSPYLPALWFDIGPQRSRVLYDLNEYFHVLGIETFYRPLIDWCESRKMEARIQPHDDFPVEVIEGSGLTTRPESEINYPYFSVVTFPHKSSAAGLRFYRGGILSTEAYTYIHFTERYRTNLKQMKICTDALLRDGITQMYNHGFLYSPEKEAAPTRDVPYANHINHQNTWWKHYRHLTPFVSRSCHLLRQGKFVADVLVYAPQANDWAERTLWTNGWRVLAYGELGKTLVANGYDFDPVNDDLLQNAARFENGQVRIKDYAYRVLILPSIRVIPLATLERIIQFVDAGGIVIALDQLPQEAAGFVDYQQNDRRLHESIRRLFPAGAGARTHSGGGQTYFVPNYAIEQQPLHRRERSANLYEPPPPLANSRAKLIEILQRHVPPDFALPGDRQSDGMTFIHRRDGEVDLYFVANMRPARTREHVRFRVFEKAPESWDPMTGHVMPLHVYRAVPGGTEVFLDLAPFESKFVVFQPRIDKPHVVKTNLAEVRAVTPDQVTGVVRFSEPVSVVVQHHDQLRRGAARVLDLPPPLHLPETWNLQLESHGFPRYDAQLTDLQSWTENPKTKHFSGTGKYELTWNLPSTLRQADVHWTLDLGSVGDVAEVRINDRSVGVRFMKPYEFDVTDALKGGRNRLTVLVTNTLINRVSGMEAPSEVPPELVSHYGETPAYVPKPGVATFEQEQGFDRLPASGLLGPVRLVPSRTVTIPLGPEANGQNN